MSTELAMALHRIGRPRLLICGDYIQDIEHHYETVRLAQEAPACPVWRETALPVLREGGAGAVWKMAEALGAQVENIMPTTGAASKFRFFVDGIQTARVDYDARPLTAEQTVRLAVHVADEVQRADCVLIADYGKGVCTDAVLRAAIDGAKARGIPCIADPHSKDWTYYRGATAIKVNQSQWVEHHENGGFDERRLVEPSLVIVTEGSEGIRMHGTQVREIGLGDACRVPCRSRRVVDVTGAGDMVLAALGVCIAGGMSWPDACKVANAAAGLKCCRRGAVPVPKCEVIADLLAGKLVPDELLTPIADAAKLRGTVVWTNGCFDGHGLHRGHLHSLAEAKKQGDVLIVGVNGDRSVKWLKGMGRPLSPIADRMNAVAALACVDYVVEVQDDEHLLKCLQAVEPAVLVKGADWRGKDIIGSEHAGRVHFVDRLVGYSTTAFSG